MPSKVTTWTRERGRYGPRLLRRAPCGRVRSQRQRGRPAPRSAQPHGSDQSDRPALALDRDSRNPQRPVTAMRLAVAGGLVVLIAGTRAAVVAGALVAGGVGRACPSALTSAVVSRAPGAPACAVGAMIAGLF